MRASTVAVTDDLDDTALRTILAGPADTISRGGLVAFPTETVYGLGGDALSPTAVGLIFLAKARPADNPLIVHIPDQSWLSRVAVVTPLAEALAATFWPGPLTLVLDRTAAVPDATTAGLSSVAVRVPASRIARTLIAQSGTPVAAPSANTSGRPSPTTAAHVEADLGSAVDWIIDGGPSTIGIESTVVDARGTVPVILREGAVTREMLGGSVMEEPGAMRSPGTRHAHYQPTARVVVAPVGRGVEVANLQQQRTDRPVGLVAGYVVGADSAVTILATPRDGSDLARGLYAALRLADDLALQTVVVEAVTETGVGRAVMDRLRRAQT